MTSVQLARDVISALLAAGVREVVVAPGSRNAPLSFAAYDAAAAGIVRLHTRIDERSAGFLALGLTKVGYRHNRRFAELGGVAEDAASAFAAAEREGSFPAQENVFAMPRGELALMEDGS